MRVEIRSDSVLIEGYVNAVARDSRPIRDRKTGKRFVEQIVPGVFERAVRRNDVDLLLNHDTTRVLGSTKTNLTLYEDSIGLRARAEITDPEVIQKAREKKLRGWSFGFLERDASEEELPNGLQRRYVEDMVLKEVSIVDERKLPVYEGTSIETRAAGEEMLTPEPLEVRADYVEAQETKVSIDMSKYQNRIKELEKETKK
jgi:HK97 family phage prohead protease